MSDAPSGWVVDAVSAGLVAPHAERNASEPNDKNVAPRSARRVGSTTTCSEGLERKFIPKDIDGDVETRSAILTKRR